MTPQCFQPFFQQHMAIPPVHQWANHMCQPWDLSCFVTDILDIPSLQGKYKDTTRAAIRILPTISLSQLSFADRIYVAMDGSHVSENGISSSTWAIAVLSGDSRLSAFLWVPAQQMWSKRFCESMVTTTFHFPEG